MTPLQQQLQTTEKGRLMIGQSDIAVQGIINKMYEYNEYQLFWKQPAMTDVLLTAIRHSETLGLAPNDYHLDALSKRLEIGLMDKLLGASEQEQAQLDILLTDAVLRLAYHLNFGKVVPDTLDPDWNLRREFFTHDPVAKMVYTLRSAEKLDKFLETSINTGLVHNNLVAALAKYKKIQAQGGWQTIASGKTLKPGMSDERVPAIKARLQASGDLEKAPIPVDDFSYDSTTEEAVKRIQYRHNLDVDGVIGKGTLQQLNVTVAQRIDSLRVNLERWRWIAKNLDDEFVLVNIAGFKVYYVKNNKLVWESKAQVGTDYRKTPVFRDEISYLVFNPTWTVPPTILRKDILPKLRKNPAYLKNKNMNVVDAKGKIIDASGIDWSNMTAGNFPYMIRQEPGPNNALGRVKIMFPNKHLVYLHDTPSKSKFNRTQRAFSSGCIRIENPFELVEMLLKDSQNWNQSRFDTILAGGKLQNVTLPVKIPVLLLYFTVEVDTEGRVIFYKDIYKRDDKVIKALDAPFHFVLPEMNNAS
ncbi:L,D-transpeptidase family protein [sulfur-oxidizing endosymbiont of Gigantopelta aegis]|uniref:L,D-transpeptidase family protein n=1 Tax=sulfur-oxidizing endosymbiont of Gigantopelta aegis TaxID=2794934 RepID=UPI0018DDB005|nr:L,D-transpeptidase family protein [sulfur-oxidizing endosymbiont of Gigantopelta aegis]